MGSLVGLTRIGLLDGTATAADKMTDTLMRAIAGIRSGSPRCSSAFIAAARRTS